MNNFKKSTLIFLGLISLFIFFAFLTTETGAYILGVLFYATFHRANHSGYSESAKINIEIVKAGMAGDEKTVAIKMLELAKLYFNSNLFDESKEILDSIKTEFLDTAFKNQVEQLRKIIQKRLEEKADQAKANGLEKRDTGRSKV